MEEMGTQAVRGEMLPLELEVQEVQEAEEALEVPLVLEEEAVVVQEAVEDSPIAVGFPQPEMVETVVVLQLQLAVILIFISRMKKYPLRLPGKVVPVEAVVQVEKKNQAKF